MAFFPLPQHANTVLLEKQNYSKSNFTKIYLTIEGIYKIYEN
jgi:hypothetical protein